MILTRCAKIRSVQHATNNQSGLPSAPSDLRLVRPRRGAIIRHTAEDALSALRGGAWDDEGRFVKSENDDFTYLGLLTIAGVATPVALKQFVARPGFLGALRSAGPRRRARRQWRGAEQLQRLGVPTSPPILLATGRFQGRVCDWLLLRHVPGEDLLHHLHRGELSVREEHDAARKTGDLVASIDSVGWFNRDSKLSNLIRTPEGVITAIDTVDIQRRPGRRVRMLRAMLSEAMGSELTPRRALMMRCLKEAVEDPKGAWRELEKYAATSRDLTPKTSVLRPLDEDNTES